MAKKVYEETKIKAIADKIREKTGGDSTYKTSEMPEGVEAVYEAGQKSMVDESKIIEATATGKGSVTLNDVSEIPHKITVFCDNVLEDCNYIGEEDLHSAGLIFGEFQYGLLYPIIQDNGDIYIYNPTNNYTMSMDNLEQIELPDTDRKYTLYYQRLTDPINSFKIYRVWGIENGREIVDPTTLKETSQFSLLVTDNDSKSVYYNPTSDGIFKDIVSYSPNMKFSIIGENINNIDITVNYHKSWGMQEEWNRFWDTYQDNGNRGNYAYAFAGFGWARKDMLPPKYPIVLKGGNYSNRGIFQQFNIDADSGVRFDLTEVCKMIDTSEATSVHSMFADAQAENITLDLSNCIDATSLFNCGNAGGDVDGIYLKVTEKLKNTVSMFTYCKNLKTLRFTEDSVIAVNINFAQSSKLYDASVDSIVSALKDLTGATSKTLTVHSNVYDRMVERGVDALVTAKNWALAKA